MNRNPVPQIYYLVPRHAGAPIKVGFTCGIEQRFKDIAKWSPIPLEVAALIDVPIDARLRLSVKAQGGRFEKLFHDRYADHRLHSEWFATHPLIRDDIVRINEGRFYLDELQQRELAA